MTTVQEKILPPPTRISLRPPEANKACLEKLAAVKSPDQAMPLITGHMKTNYETFVAEATKIGEMYKDFFTSAFEPRSVEMPKLKVV